MVEILAPPTTAAAGRRGALQGARKRLELGLHAAPGIGSGADVPRPSVEACARCAAEKASLTKISPSASQLARRRSGHCASSPAWKRVFSRHSTSPGRMAAIAARRFLADAVHRQTQPGGRSTSAIAGTTSFQRGFSDHAPSAGRNGIAGLPCRRCCAISRMVGAARSMRVAVGDLSVLHRNVQIDAHKHALVLHIDLIKRAKRRHENLLRVSRLNTSTSRRHPEARASVASEPRMSGLPDMRT